MISLIITSRSVLVFGIYSSAPFFVCRLASLFTRPFAYPLACSRIALSIFAPFRSRVSVFVRTSVRTSVRAFVRPFTHILNFAQQFQRLSVYISNSLHDLPLSLVNFLLTYSSVRPVVRLPFDCSPSPSTVHLPIRSSTYSASLQNCPCQSRCPLYYVWLLIFDSHLIILLFRNIACSFFENLNIRLQDKSFAIGNHFLISLSLAALI